MTSSTAPVALDWSKGGCANGHEPFVDLAGRWERVEAPDDDQTVTVRSFDPATRTYAATRYFLDADAMTAARKRRGTAIASCTADPAAMAQASEAAAAIKAQLPPLPNEKLVYSCTAGR